VAQPVAVAVVAGYLEKASSRAAPRHLPNFLQLHKSVAEVVEQQEQQQEQVVESEALLRGTGHNRLLLTEVWEVALEKCQQTCERHVVEEEGELLEAP